MNFDAGNGVVETHWKVFTTRRYWRDKCKAGFKGW